MGFFSKLFGGKEEKQPVIPENLPVQTSVLQGIAMLNLTEILQPRHSDYQDYSFELRREARSTSDGSEDDAGMDSLKVKYAFDFDYVVFDEALLRENIGDDSLDEALNELFYVVLTAFNSITVKIIEGDANDFAAQLLDRFNHACGDWGVKGRQLSAKSIAPTDEYREFYAAYKEVWG